MASPPRPPRCPFSSFILHLSEAQVDAKMTEWHTYAIHWGERMPLARRRLRARGSFRVDAETVLDCDTSPAGALGLALAGQAVYGRQARGAGSSRVCWAGAAANGWKWPGWMSGWARSIPERPAGYHL